jgi:hypothetical protein
MTYNALLCLSGAFFVGLVFNGLHLYLQKNMEDQEFELKNLEFEKSLALRNFEIENFWKRGWFFGALLLSIVAGYFKLFSENDDYCIYISFLGLIVSLAQSLMNRGSKYWQERWENKTKNKESLLGIDVTKTRKYSNEKYFLDASTLAKNENILSMAHRFSVSKLTILIWDVITLMWIVVWLKDWHLNFKATVNIWAVPIHILIIGYIIVFFRKGKVFGSFTKGRGVQDHDNDVNSEFYGDSEKYIEGMNDVTNSTL